MSELKIKKLRGSGGYVMAKISEDEQQKGNLGGPDLFLAPLARLDSIKISKYYCNVCEKDYQGAPKIEFSNPNEEVAENLLLIEKGQYICNECSSIIAEYREFRKPKDNNNVGNAISEEVRSDNISEQSIKKNGDKDNVSFNSIIGMYVYDENAIKIGIAKQVGIDSSQSIVLAVAKEDGTTTTINWNRIKKIGEIIMLSDDKIENDTSHLKCSNCNFINKQGSKFCEKCGTNVS